ncbi:MAG: Dipeptidylaminopeptidase/acylaminoacyl-peptidase -like protein, partial [Verrucomicrobiales bacterium]|nr:Dipeptidylaminopeptidase/acylaminoacyl-peptidase -like protein [Verrucomicrobiales bacterium]
WERNNDQSPRAFLRRDFVLFCPTWRGEVNNPGSFELYLGEVNDLLAAVKYVRALHYVDSARIYFVGYSASGTLALHAAETKNGLRALFSIGGGADFSHEMADGKGYEETPFDLGDKKEIEIRNPRSFVAFIQSPVYFFEGGNSWYAPDGCRMEILAKALGKPFQAIIVPGAHHWNVLQPACDYIAHQLLLDTNETVNFQFSAVEARKYLPSGQPSAALK